MARRPSGIDAAVLRRFSRGGRQHANAAKTIENGLRLAESRSRAQAHCDAKGKATVHELTPNMTGFHVLELAVDAKGGPRLVSKHVDRNRFNVYQKTDAETARFCAFVKKLKPNSVARPERKKRLAF